MIYDVFEVENIRKKLEISQREIADKVGVAQPHISKIENGNTNPSLEVMRKITAAIEEIKTERENHDGYRA